MRHLIVAALTGAALAGAALPTPASASCYGRKTTGTVVGGIGGALIGNSIARGGGGAILGGLGGAVAGHAIAASSCRHYYYRHSYYRPAYHRYYERRSARYGRYDANRDYAYGAPQPSPAGYAGGPSGACPLVNRSYYDDRGNLITQEVPSCGR